jgi:sigma-B regulation protein RsbU (phosphoserine phosphatase)
VTLRRRVLIASGSGFALILLGFVIVIIQFSSISNSQSRLDNVLLPASQLADSLILAQTSVSGDLSDYILTGSDEALASYQSSLSTTSSLESSLIGVLGDSDPALMALVESSTAAQRAWVSADAQPALDAMADGKSTKAARITNKIRASSAYDSMILATNTLQTEIENQRAATVNNVSGSARVLGFLLIFGGLVLLGGFIAYFVLFQRWVIYPLMDIRKDLQLATRDPAHTHPIEPLGPPEFITLAKDAEGLRRKLVSEIDDAETARKGLQQDAPLVAAVRTEMQVDSRIHCPGVAIAGLASNAEGSLAGDYWDYVPLDDHRVALIVADVSGHGPTSNVVALRVRAIMKAAIVETGSLEQAVKLAAASTLTDEHFVTAILMLIDTSTNSIEWINAGHPAAIGVTHDKDDFYLDITGPLISALGGTWEMQSHPFDPGDVVLGVTDGFLEGQALTTGESEAESASIARMLRTLDAPMRRQPEEIVHRLVSHIREVAPRWHSDDTTVVAISRLD